MWFSASFASSRRFGEPFVDVPICHNMLPDVSMTITRLKGGNPASVMTTLLSLAVGTSSSNR
ncbi:hypothetical protein ABR855_09960, partial [Aeromonas hydrophila]|uniref:hypothetical protein n=1 Tax=Aeromonas hydrophila TaxID=644 RepID=UPI003305D3BA